MEGQAIQRLVGMGAYIVVMIVIGLWYIRRSNSNPEEYFLGRRGLGPWVAAMSAEASDMSGWLLMGLPGVAYYTGMGEAFWTAVGLFIGTWINWQIVAKRLRVYSQVANNSITLPEYFSNRFHDKRRVLSTIAAIMILVFFSIYTGSQFMTFGKLFGFAFDANDYYATMVILGAVLVFMYTLLGGFLAVSNTDFIQGIMMIIALIMVLAVGFYTVEGLSGISSQLANFPRFLDVFGIATPDTTGGTQTVLNGAPLFGPGANYSLLSIVSCLAWGLGYFGMPQVLVRFMAIKERSKIKQARSIAIIWCLISLFAAVAIGIIGRALYPGMLTTAGSAETIFLNMAVRFFPPLLAGLVLSGILAASMSSSDSYMLIVSSALANDLFKDVFNKKASENLVMWVARITMLGVTIFGVVVALSGNDSIFRIVSYAWAGLGAAFGPLILFSLFWQRTTYPAAVAGMASGGIMVFVWKEGISRLGGIWAVYELLPAFLISCALIVIVSLCTAPPNRTIQSEFEQVQKELAL
ncbi:sodium:proline symporter [Spirochaetia bacterium]|nr:sodium:proline symporter [Spirochaetia bacterium]